MCPGHWFSNRNVVIKGRTTGEGYLMVKKNILPLIPKIPGLSHVELINAFF